MLSLVVFVIYGWFCIKIVFEIQKNRHILLDSGLTVASVNGVLVMLLMYLVPVFLLAFPFYAKWGFLNPLFFAPIYVVGLWRASRLQKIMPTEYNHQIAAVGYVKKSFDLALSGLVIVAMLLIVEMYYYGIGSVFS